MNTSIRFAVTLVSLFFIVLTVGAIAQQQNQDILSKAQQMLKDYKVPPPTHAPETETPQQSWDRNDRGGKSPTIQGQAVIPSNNQFLGKEKNRAFFEQLQNKPALLSPSELRQQTTEKIQKGELKNLQPKSEQERMNEFQEFVKQDQQKRGIRVPALPTDEETKKYIEQHKELEKNKTLDQVSIVDGYVFNDMNHNGVRDTLEPGIPNWRVFLTINSTGVTIEGLTDVNGFYSFNNISADWYFPYNQDSAGWFRTYDDGHKWYYLTGTDSLRNINFGEWQIVPNFISGMKFNDFNRNGVKDTLEPGISGWTMKLYEYNTGIWRTTVTDAQGNYRFDSIMTTGYFQVAEEQQTGWSQTFPNSGYYTVNLNWESVTNLDFGNRVLYPDVLKGTVYNDINHNTIREPEEVGLEGWTITVSSYNTGFTASVITDSYGNYLVPTNGNPDYYFVTETSQPGWYTTTTNPVSWINLTGIGDTIHNNFGNWLVPLSSIRGMKFNDLDNNGYLDVGEPGLPGWTIHAYKVSTGQTYTTVTDQNGNYSFDSLTMVSEYQISEEQQLDWVQTTPNGPYYQTYVAGDTVNSINFGNYLAPTTTLRVNTLPSYSVNANYGNAVAGEALAVWGNLHGGVVPLHYVLDYGDGTIDSGIITNRHYVGSNHTYATAGYYTMSLTVLDNVGALDVDQSVIRVFAVGNPEIRRNMAIEKGLLYDYLNQYATGFFTGSDYVAATGAAVLSFEENGHLPSNNFNTDIYAEYVKLGLNYLFSQASNQNIYLQLAGDPDSDADGFGAYLSSSVYANGIGLLAVLGAHPSAASAQSDIITNGVYTGQTYYDFIIDALDQIAFSQTDTTEYGRGGWRYTSNAPSNGSSDNSAVQWHALVIEAAEKLWGRSIQPFVKSELLKWLQYSQDGTGGFGYTDPGNWNNVAKTGSGIGSYAALDAPSSSSPVINAISFLNTEWMNDNFGNLYAMYAVKKGLSIIDNRSGVSLIGAHNWRDEYNDYLITNQLSTGSWNGGSWVTGPDALSASFGVLILTPGVSQLRPVAVIAPISSKPPTTSFQVDGSGSHHRDPNKTLVEYLWDWNDSDGVNWNTPDAVGQNPTNPGYINSGSYRISLRVKDNSDPPLYDYDSKLVVVQNTNNPPVAVAIPPDRGPSYAARVGEPILLDGRASWDPDSASGDHIVNYRWDLNGNGNYYDPTDATTDTVTVVFNNEYNGQVGLRVYDTYGDSSSNIAYITIVASRKDLFVQQLLLSPSFGQPGDSINVFAVFKNDDISNTNVSNVLVRFFDENPLTIGNQIGANFYIDLPIGAIDTLQTKIAVPSLPSGNRNLYVYLDANANVPEWNEMNNLMLFQFHVGTFASIRGVKFDDKNGNGQNDGEPGIEGWRIILMGSENDTAITDIDGKYDFEQIKSGTYTVTEEQREGWIQTYPIDPPTYTIQITNDSIYQNVNFGNFHLITLSGMKFQDTNRDSLKDELEPGLSNWTIRLIKNADTTVTITDTLGYYTFTGIGPGLYTVEEKQQSGWNQTYPHNPSYYSVEPWSGKDEGGKDFGNTYITGISGMKFNDLNGNGVKDSAEPGLPNWLIALSGPVVDTTITDASGNYSFSLIGPGTYTVREVLQTGWVQTTSNPAPIVFTGEQMVTGIDFGNFKLPSISGVKFLDANGNGVKDQGENGLQGWTIKATKGVSVKSTVTTLDGSYSFSFSVSETGTWVMRELLQEGWTQTYPANLTYSVVVQSGTNAVNIDFGNFQSGTISGKKYEDIAGDSLIAGDPTLNGWKIKLYRDTILVASVMTSGNGDYSFVNLIPGAYSIQESLQTGWVQTYPANGVYSIMLSSGMNATGKDFANFKLGTISGVKFNDTNGDSVKGGAESGLANWQIILTKGQHADTLLTDSLGNYSFTGLFTGTYQLTEVQQNGWYSTVPATGSYSVDVVSGAVMTAKNFGNFKYGSISGTKFFDRDSSGTQNCTCEEPLAGFKIVLSGASISPDTVMTDSLGTFSFTNVPAGLYTISEALTALWRQTVPAHGTPYSVTVKSGLDTAGFVFGNFHLLDTGKFRTFILSDYNKTATAVKKSGFISNPNAGNVRDNVFFKHGFGLETPSDSGYLRVGVKRYDSSLVYGWYFHRWTIYKKAAVKTWIYNTKIWGLKRVPKSKPSQYVPRNPATYLGFTGEKVTETYFGNAGNHLTVELTTLKTNVAASDLEITPKGLGDLIYISRTGGSDTAFTGKSIRKIIADADTSLTMGRKIHQVTSGQNDTTYRCSVSHLIALDSVISKINKEFRSTATKLDTISTNPLKIKGVKALYKVLYLVRDSINSLPLTHFDANYATEEDQPLEYRLDQNYPNPFNPTTTIQFELSVQSKVTLRVYNLLGQEVATVLNNEDMDGGMQAIEFDASTFSSGVYFYRLEANGVDEEGVKHSFTSVKKMMMIK